MAFPSATQRTSIAGPAGKIELLTDSASGTPAGFAVIAHPHPLQGGTAEHKVPQLLARTLAAHGYLAVRPNFRGVGQTEGEHDHGDGETADTLAVIDALRGAHPGQRIVLAGFSFGAYVMARAAHELTRQGAAFDRLVLTGMPSGSIHGRQYDTPAVPGHALVIHGERDERVALQALYDWARPQMLPVVVVPGADHFFTGKLPVLRRLVEAHLASPPAPADGQG